MNKKDGSQGHFCEESPPTTADDAQLLSGAVDTHAHVFWAHSPRTVDARYDPGYEATVACYLDNLKAHHIAHGMLVQPSFLGTGNSCLLRSLRVGQGRLSGIAVIDPGVGVASLYDMAMRGVKGIRLNLIGRPLPDLQGGVWHRALKVVAELGWVVCVQAIAEQWVEILPYLRSLGLSVVVDHMGRPATSDPRDCPGFTAILKELGSGRVWVKLSAPYRFGHDRAERAAAILLREAGAERLMWGSDWPWTQHEADGQTFGDCLNWLKAWVPDPTLQQTILSKTPRLLFGLPI